MMWKILPTLKKYITHLNAMDYFQNNTRPTMYKSAYLQKGKNQMKKCSHCGD